MSAFFKTDRLWERQSDFMVRGSGLWDTVAMPKKRIGGRPNEERKVKELLAQDRVAPSGEEEIARGNEEFMQCGKT